MAEPRPSQEALALDAADALAPMRGRFHLPRGPDGRTAIYLCGHSLGPQPAAAATAVIVVGTAEPQKTFVLTADRPFLFAIVDGPTGAVLFLGRVLDPTAK